MEHFIDAVRKYPCLWNTAAIEYRDQELKDAAWAEVMKETNLVSVKEVKLKWKKLRDSYRDALKRQSEMLAKDPANHSKKNYPWKYMSLMQFLQPHMNNRKKTGPGAGGESPPQPPVAENGRSESDSESEPESSPKRKSHERLTVIDRKLDYLCKAHTAHTSHTSHTSHTKRHRDHDRPGAPAPAPPPDPLDIFFNSMCQSTKRLPYPTQIKVKKILFTAVIEAEEQAVAEQQNYANLWTQGALSSSSEEGGGEEEDRKPS